MSLTTPGDSQVQSVTPVEAVAEPRRELGLAKFLATTITSTEGPTLVEEPDRLLTEAVDLAVRMHAAQVQLLAAFPQ